VVSSTVRPHFNPGKDLVPILQEAGWAPEQVLTGGKSRPHRDSIPDRPARSQSLYQLSYRAHNVIIFTGLLTERLERERQQYTFIVMWMQCNTSSLIIRYNEMSNTFVTSVPFLFVYIHDGIHLVE